MAQSLTKDLQTKPTLIGEGNKDVAEMKMLIAIGPRLILKVRTLESALKCDTTWNHCLTSKRNASPANAKNIEPGLACFETEPTRCSKLDQANSAGSRHAVTAMHIQYATAHPSADHADS